jgi:glycyl-tRNA synthetase
VIEPSFGIGRVMYALFEHSFSTRDDDEVRGWMRLPPRIAPLKVALLPLLTNNPAKYNPILFRMGAPRMPFWLNFFWTTDFFVSFVFAADDLRVRGITYRIDESGVSVGRRYVRFGAVA